jgi:hypothetical protein
LADAGRPLALPDVENVSGNRESVLEEIANARKNYLDFVRRSGPLIMSNDEQVAFQKALGRLIAFLKLDETCFKSISSVPQTRGPADSEQPGTNGKQSPVDFIVSAAVLSPWQLHC